MKYFRSYPLGLQLVLFLLMIFSIGFLGLSLAYAYLAKFTTFNYEQLLAGIDEHSPMALINSSLVVQGILSVSIFLAPPLIFSYLTHPQPKEYLGLSKPGKKIQWILVILIMLGAIPLLQMIEGLISQINFGATIKAEQAANDNMMNAFLNIPTFAAFLKALLVLAIIPAIGEEMFFRGILLRFVKKYTRTMAFPIIITAAVFAYAHTNVYGFVSIFLAGVLLAVIYNLTGSLWCSILAHVFFNGFQVILSYLGHNSPAVKAFNESNNVSVYLVIGGAIIFGVSFYLLLKNKTPLPPNWTDDFPPSVPATEEWDFMSKK
jgi:uncharacterized protein